MLKLVIDAKTCRSISVVIKFSGGDSPDINYLGRGTPLQTPPHDPSFTIPISDTAPFRCTFLDMPLEKLCQCCRVNFLQWHHSMAKCQNFQRSPTHFSASSYCFRDIKISNCWTLESRSRSQNAVLQLHHSMANVKIYKCNFLHLLVFAKVWSVRTILTDWQTDTHRNEHA